MATSFSMTSLKYARTLMGLPQRTIAERMGISQSVVSRLEQKPFHEITIQQADAFMAAIYDERLKTIYRIESTVNGKVQSITLITE